MSARRPGTGPLGSIVLALGMLHGCANDAPESTNAAGGDAQTDASTSSSSTSANASSEKSSRAKAIIEELKLHQEFVGHLGGGATLAKIPSTAGKVGAFQLAADGTPASRFTVLGSDSLLVELPTDASGPVHLGISGRPQVFVELTPLETTHVVAEPYEGALVFGEAATDTDVVHIVEKTRMEEIHVLRSRSAPTVLRSTLTTGAEVREVRVRGGVIEVVDITGNVVLTSAPLFAVDAKGVRREVVARLETSGEARVLVCELDTTGLEFPIAVDPVWTAATPMPTARSHATSIPLPTGPILVAGGLLGDGTTTGNTELWDPGTGVWVTKGSMVKKRHSFGAVNIAGGRVFAAGGYDSGGVPVNAYEVYDSGTWTQNSGFPHADGFVVKLASGRVLVGAGYTSATASTNGVHLWDPGSGWVTPDPSGMTTSRVAPSATLLPSGKLFVAGGLSLSGSAFNTTEVFDPPANSFSGGPTMSTPRGRHFAVLLSSGKVLVGGGTGASGPLSSAELYDPGTNTWAGAASMSTPRVGAACVLLGNGKVLVAGGSPASGSLLDTAEVYDPSVNTWTNVGTMSAKRANIANMGAYIGGISALIPGGAISAGSPAPVTASADIYNDGAANGAACLTNSACASGYCVDGVCCNTACGGQCEACNGTPSGTCKAVSGAPHGSRTPCVGSGVCQAQCDGTVTTACAAPPTATTSCGTASCSGGIATSARSCDGTGVCTSASSTTCSPYLCQSAPGTGCKSSCTVAATDCASGYNCIGGICKTGGGLGTACSVASDCGSGNCVDNVCCSTASCSAPQKCNANGLGTCSKPLGAVCSVGGECGSTYCVDSVCCDKPCSGQCEACSVTPGSCRPVVGATIGTRTACSGTGSCQATCDGNDTTTCRSVPGSSTNCAAATCSSAIATTARYCDGAGSCASGTTLGCGAYVCGATTCLTSCTTDTQCSSGYFCSGGACTLKLTNGSVCTTGAGNQCQSGNCVDGACCTSSSCTAPATCNANGLGTCARALGVTCTSGAQCAAGNCVDGVCCNSSCSGQCEACDVGGSSGTCSAVVGLPHGTRTTCTGTGACQAQCDGSNHLACGTFPGVSTICAAATCASGSSTPTRLCNGGGTCTAASASSCGAYLCNGTTACKTTCTPATGATDCATGYFCSGSSCITTGAAGTVCSSAGQCASGNCVDSVCCTSTSCTSPLKCNANTTGTCSKPNGTTCTLGTECGSGNCVDGVCCNLACSGQCEACDIGGSVGQCLPVVGTPHSGVTSRASCTGTGTCKASCDGSNRIACGAPPGTSTVCAAASCATGSATPTAYCDGIGACGAVTSSSCGAYICGGTSCKSNCTSISDCATGFYCNAASCVPKLSLGVTCSAGTECTSGNCVDAVCCSSSSCGAGLKCSSKGDGTCSKPLGTTCSTDSECGSGKCVDGVCCDSACSGQCEACDVGGSVGKCSAVIGKVHGTVRTACTGSGACQSSCNGSDRLSCGAVPGTSTICGPASCTTGSVTPASFCDGLGSCAAASPSSCGAYLCAATTCKSACTTSTDCATGYGCKDGRCVTTGALGTICTDDTQCKSTHCTPSGPGGNVCCNAATCPTGSICADASSPEAGNCVKDNGQTCVTSADCKSGFCVDGVCCDGGCTGQCEACDIPGGLGKCTGVSGPPHGSRTKCDGGAADVCKALACDSSKDRSKCVGFLNGPSTECTAASCKDGSATTEAFCDGSGTCKAGATSSCGTFACGDKTCKDKCLVDTDCGAGFICNKDSGKCVPPTATCSADGTSSVAADKTVKPCGPFRCDTSTGNCYTKCTASDECAPGATCDGTACIADPTGDAQSGGGCAVSPSDSGRREGSEGNGGAGLAGLVVGAAALAIAGRRRRR